MRSRNPVYPLPQGAFSIHINGDHKYIYIIYKYKYIYLYILTYAMLRSFFTFRYT